MPADKFVAESEIFVAHRNYSLAYFGDDWCGHLPLFFLKRDGLCARRETIEARAKDGEKIFECIESTNFLENLCVESKRDRGTEDAERRIFGKLF